MANSKKAIKRILISLVFLGIVPNLYGQFLKNLKEKIVGEVNQEIIGKSEELFKVNDTGPSTPETGGEIPKIGQAKNQTIGSDKKPTLEKKKDKPIQTDVYTVTYQPPTSNFIPITIQSHNGLPRYGETYFRRGQTVPIDRNAYEALVELRFLKNQYAAMDRSKLTLSDQRNASDLKQKYSYFAQQHLLRLAGYVCSEEVLIDYFCDAKATTLNTKKYSTSNKEIPCRLVDRDGNRLPASHWGGNGTNEFRQNRVYREFLINYFGELQSWASSFYENDEQIAYYVGRTYVSGKYDFKNKGYWINGLLGTTNFILHPTNFLAYSENEKKIKNSSDKFFLAMEPDKAKELGLLEGGPLFTTIKVNVFPRLANNNRLLYDFSLIDQTFKIYKDPLLTNEIGEIDLNKLISKN